MKGPLGDLPRLSRSARHALIGVGVAAVGQSAATVMAAVLLAELLARLVAGDQRVDLVASVMFALAVVIRSLSMWAAETLAARGAVGAKRELRGAVVDHALRRGPEWIAERGAVGLARLAVDELDALDEYFARLLPALINAVVLPVGVGTWILTEDVGSAMVIAVTVPLLPVFGVLIGWFTEDRTRRVARSADRLAVRLTELIAVFPVLSVFGRASAQRSLVDRLSDEHRRAGMSTLRVAFLSALVLELVASLSVAGVAVGIGLRLVDGHLDLETGLTVLLLTPECYLALRAVGAAFHAGEDGLAAVNRVSEIISDPRSDNHRPPVGSDPGHGQQPGPGGLSGSDSGQWSGPGDSDADHGRPSGSLGSDDGQELRQDGLVGSDNGRWPGSGSPGLVIRDLRIRRRSGFAPDGASLTVPPGRIVRCDGDLGPSGAGKSSVMSAVLGFVQPSGGTIQFDGVDMSTLDEAGLVQWRERIAWVPQHPEFFAPTVRAELSRVAATSTDADVLVTVAARRAQAVHLIDREVDRLSMGERQRVAIARALIRIRAGARLLLLDEPTAHLDPVTAGRMNELFSELADDGVAVLIATHRTAVDNGLIDLSRRDERRAEPVAGRLPMIDRRGLFGAGVGALSVISGVALTACAAWLIAKASTQPPIAALTVAVLGVRLFALLKAVLRYGERLVSHDAAFRSAGRLRAVIWDSLRPARLVGRGTETARRLTDDVDMVRDSVPRLYGPPIVAAIAAASAVVVETMILPSAGSLLAIGLVVAGVGGPALALLVQRRAEAVLATRRGELWRMVHGLFRASADLLADGSSRALRAELDARDDELSRQAARRALGVGAGTALIQLVLGGVALACVWESAGVRGLDPVMVPLLVLVPLAAAEFLAPLPAAVTRWGPARAAAGRVAELTVRVDPDQPHSARRVADDSGRVRMREVSLSWGGAEVLRGIDLDIPSGATAVIVGGSGAGKSTLVAGLLGFLEPTAGVLETPTRIAWCPQDPLLVSTSVRENLRLGDPHADDQRLARVLRLVELPDWAERLDVTIGTGGRSMSGGEAARLALARTVLRAAHCELVVLDEPTAHLDLDTSARVSTALRAEFAGRTVIQVTHHPAEVEADLIIKVGDGTVRTAVGAPR